MNKLLPMIFLLLSGGVILAQEKVKDGTVSSTDSQTQASAILELESNNKGFLTPRMTTTQRDAVANWPEGSVIFNTTAGTIEYYNGTAWIRFTTTMVDRRRSKNYA